MRVSPCASLCHPVSPQPSAVHFSSFLGFCYRFCVGFCLSRAGGEDGEWWGRGQQGTAGACKGLQGYVALRLSCMQAVYPSRFVLPLWPAASLVSRSLSLSLLSLPLSLCLPLLLSFSQSEGLSKIILPMGQAAAAAAIATLSIVLARKSEQCQLISCSCVCVCVCAYSVCVCVCVK